MAFRHIRSPPIATKTEDVTHSDGVDSHDKQTKTESESKLGETGTTAQQTESSEDRKDARDSNDRKPYDRKYNDRKHPNNGPYKRRNKSKFDPSALPETDDPDEIRKQVCSSNALETYT